MGGAPGLIGPCRTRPSSLASCAAPSRSSRSRPSSQLLSMWRREPASTPSTSSASSPSSRTSSWPRSTCCPGWPRRPWANRPAHSFGPPPRPTSSSSASCMQRCWPRSRKRAACQSRGPTSCCTSSPRSTASSTGSSSGTACGCPSTGVVVLLFPAVWLVVVLLRGATDGWVPYPFLDPGQEYAAVAGYCVVILVAFFVIGAFVFWGSRIGRRVVSPTAS